MTTIAYCKGKLAADSQSTVGGRRRIGPAKKIFTPGEGDKWKLLGRNVAAFGLAGRASALELIKQALAVGVQSSQPITVKDINFSTLVLCETGEVFYWACQRDSKKGEDIHELVPVTGPIAIGSGATLAECALSLGFSAKKAVKAAIKLDTSSGGPVMVFKMPKKKGKTKET